ncbi:MAG: aldehyde dehydrogenase family protein, partial [Gammaproteobacteria bacterium]
MLSTTPSSPSTPLRDTITNAYRMDETTCLNQLLPLAAFSDPELVHISATAKQLVMETREYKKKQSKMDALLHQFDLSTEEGIALMCLAEALLRIPDKETMDKFISDKLSTADWKSHLDSHHSLFINAATWALLLTGKVYAPTLSTEKNLTASLTRTVSRLGVAMIRPTVLQMMKALGKQFVMGENIAAALQRAQPLEAMGYTFSYDMLGEAARTAADAEHYYAAYTQAIEAIGQAAATDNPIKNPSISIKLSALHPRYDYAKQERVLRELTPRLLTLAQQAKKYHLSMTIDAEEADRLDLSLDIFEKVFADPSLAEWDGLGFVVQSYQKRAAFVIDWLADLSTRHHKRIMLRLVKGAYWDAEIKMSQIQGLNGYPVFTRKNATDVSFLACARKLLAKPDCFYPQFGTHNAYSVAAILEMTQPHHLEFEFQCLHGIGRPLYDQIVDKNRCRIYAPVGTHRDLLGYLVRRLLENGANTSFINRLADDTIPIEKIIADPVARIAALPSKPHPNIPLPKDIYGAWQNSMGIDLSNRSQFLTLKKQMEAVDQEKWTTPSQATEAQIEEALATATDAAQSWGRMTVEERAIILERAADLFQEAMPKLMTILTREGGKTILDSLSEVRETIDYCRYYAYQARQDLTPVTLPGPTGETNQLSLHPRGVIACISPWNFPLAIFTGQILAALVTGNAVIAKPAEQTPLIAFEAVRILHQAGIPPAVLH